MTVPSIFGQDSEGVLTILSKLEEGSAKYFPKEEGCPVSVLTVSMKLSIPITESLENRPPNLEAFVFGSKPVRYSTSNHQISRTQSAGEDYSIVLYARSQLPSIGRLGNLNDTRET